ncbi:TonB-dependent receptor [Puia sp.]|uniref:SusC/RagA family TonB-linked outer membrane protein n=1 Tax=Puia sp. TaxID=2045100 RepID=UPI002F4038DC
MKVKLRLRELLFLPLLFLSTLAVFGQERTITGNISNKSTGQPLPGATVIVKGTRTAVTTDDAGNFRIAVPAEAKMLVISHIGMVTQELAIPMSGSLSVQLVQSAGSQMDEVVVVGYGTQRKSVVTGAISSVHASDLENQPVVRVEQALQGRTSGLTISSQTGAPGSAATVRLRGFTSFGNGKNDPLWVIDGVVIDAGGIGYLNQDDIESIEVLKDAASAAIYGTRAAAGVILITTKKGKAGAPRISYNGYYGWQEPAKKLHLMDATQYATMRNQAATAAGNAAPFADPNSFGKGTDWQKTIFNYKAPKMNHELSISGGNEKSTYFTSFGYTDIQGQIATPVSRYTRMNYRINTNFRPAKWISFGENLGFEHGKTRGPGEINREYGGVISSALNLDPITPAIVYDSIGQKQFVAQTPQQVAAATRSPRGYYYGISPYVGQEMKNPLASIQNRRGNYSWDNNLVGNAYIDLSPVKGLVIHSSLGTKMAFYGSENFTPSVFYNTSTSIGPTSLSRNQNWTINWNVENTVSYNRGFGRHNVTLLGGWGEYKDGNARGSTVVYNNVVATNFDNASFINGVLPTDRQNSTASDGTDHRINSLFSRVQYNFGEKYLLTALIRRDGSSRFGTNNKFGYFPSVSVGWVPTLENFFPASNVINTLKVRGSYGVTGNDGIGDFAYIPTVGSGGQRNYQFGDTLHIGYSPNAPANPDLKWEQTSQLDIGLDAVLFKTLTFTVDIYKKKTTGILQTPAIPAYAGYGSFAQNFDDLENKGIEFEAGYRKKLGEITLGVNGNISFYQNKVTRILPGTTFFEDNSASFQTLGNITRSTLNQPYQRYFGYKILGIFQNQADIDSYVGSDKATKLQPKAKPGDLKFANLQNDNIIDGNDRTYLGNPNPTVSFGLTINLAYKQFDFTMFGGGSGGNKVFQGLRRLDIGTANYLAKYQNAWTPGHTNTNLPRIVDGDPNQNYSKMTSLYLENGDYFKLRTVQVGYNLPKSMLNRWGCQRLRVYALVENLFTITRYSGFDPELGVSPDAGGGAQYGIDRGAYVPARSLLVGVNVGF